MSGKMRGTIRFSMPRDKVELFVEMCYKVGIDVLIQPDGAVNATWDGTLEELHEVLQKEIDRRSSENP